jgi:hypothetical protein
MTSWSESGDPGRDSATTMRCAREPVAVWLGEERIELRWLGPKQNNGVGSDGGCASSSGSKTREGAPVGVRSAASPLLAAARVQEGGWVGENPAVIPCWKAKVFSSLLFVRVWIHT